MPMATETRPRPASGVDLDIHNDNSCDASSQRVPSNSSILGDLPLGNIQNIAKGSVDSLALDFNNLHIHNPAKENIYDQQTTKFRARKARPQVELTTFQTPSTELDVDFSSTRAVSGSNASIVSHEDEGTLPTEQPPRSGGPYLAQQPRAARETPRRSLNAAREDMDSSQAGQKKYLFGCNLIHRRTQSGGDATKDARSANIYTILATRVEEKTGSSEPAIIEETDNMSTTTQVLEADTTIIRLAESQTEEPEIQRDSEATLDTEHDEHHDTVLSHSPSPSVHNAAPRIEDSVEALDKLEEELEALNDVARVNRVLSPETGKAHPPAVMQTIADTVAKTPTTLQRTGSTATRRPGTETVRAKRVERMLSVRKSTSMAFDDKVLTAAKPAGPRKSMVARPTSLLPPKAPAKSSKPPTVSTFELPGEAVARRLKEQREARLSRHITPEEAAVVAAAFSPSKPHVKSTKVPTRPTFELPGEAISRRKREEREAKLRAQEEEERKRREFKARPIRNSIAPNSYPRETVASRARQSKVAPQTENATTEDSVATPRVSPAKKRSSMAATSSSTSRASLSGTSTLSRGRGLMVAPVDSHIGRAASTATSTTGSIHGGGSVGKHSTVSSEEAQQQKLRGKEILARDNVYAVDRERERREREATQAQARQAAAIRSRQLSREWAEKHRTKEAVRASAGASTSS
ncbi:hypothetical protein B0H63DRAFT_558654 [Podospora didyma]|uniref:Carboxylesterase family protein n=1 Tax=Podospora didyma TaxID=330526 RepID=A0AAE0U154_9PEZI|nr:hypothetical protein B0H63DRAFT_558654 [Podospora didyma]